MRLKELRKYKRLTQSEMANFIGVNQNTYSYWENGKSKIDNETLTKLADFFGVTIDYLLGRDIQETKNDLSADESKKVDEIYEIYDKLSDEAKEKLRGYGFDLLGNPKNLK